MLLVAVCLGGFLFACAEEPKSQDVESAEPVVVRDPQIAKDSIAAVKLDSATVAYMKTFNLVDLSKIDYFCGKFNAAGFFN